MQLTLLGGVLALLFVWLYVRRRNASQKPPEQADLKSPGNTAYHAVSLRFEADACSAAKELGGRRFLSNAAPRLPLPACNALECRCRFAHHKDRRVGKERRSPFGAGRFSGTTGSFEQERRERRDRRKKTDIETELDSF